MFPVLFPQVRIFREIHNNLYLKSERRLSPASLPPSRRDSQRGGGGGCRGRSSVSLYVSPLVFSNPGTHTSFDLPMGPLRCNSITSHCDIHTYTAVHPGKKNIKYVTNNRTLRYIKNNTIAATTYMHPHVHSHTHKLKQTFDLHAKFQPPRAKTVAAKEWEHFYGTTDRPTDRASYKTAGRS